MSDSELLCVISKMDEQVKKQALDIAKQILNEEINPNEGCDKLAMICEDSDYPSEISIFSLLSHDQRGHEDLGFDLENTAIEIIDECNKFVSNHT